MLTYHTAKPKISEPDVDEIKTILHSLKNNKAHGEDDINSELLKITEIRLIVQIYQLIKNTWRHERYRKIGIWQ